MREESWYNIDYPKEDKVVDITNFPDNLGKDNQKEYLEGDLGKTCILHDEIRINIKRTLYNRIEIHIF